MAGDLVLISGATGHIGFRVVVEALLAGYTVRAAVRNETGVAKVKAAKSVQPFADKLTFVLIPDIEAEGAWDHVLEGVKYIIHVASPIPNQKESVQDHEWDSRIINPAVQGTMSLLRSAAKYGTSLERVVITSSVVAMVEWTAMFSESGEVFNEKSRTSRPSGPYESLFEAYSASKVIALEEAESFVAAAKPTWDLVHVAPTFTIGKNELVTTTEDILVGTNSTAFGQVLGHDIGSTPSASVFVNDVARMHVLALNPSVPGGEVFIGVSENSTTNWIDSLEIVKKNFPEAYKAGVFPLSGKNETKKFLVNNDYSRKILKTGEFVDYEGQVKSVTEHYLELKALEHDRA